MGLHFIIDGYNAVHKIPVCQGVSLRASREKLLQVITGHKLCGSSKNRVTVVFDGKEGIDHPWENSDEEVIFTKNETADNKIKRMVEKSKAPRQVVVVTDDREIKYYTRSVGATVKGVEEFFEKIYKRQRKISNREKFAEFDSKAEEITRELKKIWLKQE